MEFNIISNFQSFIPIYSFQKHDPFDVSILHFIIRIDLFNLPMTTFVGTYALNNTFINHHLQTTLYTTFMKSHFV